ncbi:MAG: thioredoxin domain-containing protein [Saprospiraceae bacterium]
MNQLQYETSPYLLQHQHNPVNWYAWKPEALAKAKAENKPILVSIGYSTCHWCHVMERESFENEEIAKIMNEYFVCIKVDREERPDVDQIYMEACQIMTGQGGWPLNCFLLPDGRPFFAGTYFPPRPAHGRPSWSQVLTRLADAYSNKYETVEQQATQLSEILQGSGSKFINQAATELEQEKILNPVLTDNIFYHLKDNFDTEEGGFGGAPKFPGSMNLSFLLSYFHFTQKEESKQHALFSLDRMIRGGIYDQLGGGFARYTVDRAWLVPHFEKMLYDNALIVSSLTDAYLLTQDRIYKDTIDDTLAFIQREMLSAEGGFYSAFDADSEGVEGKFYVWDKSEIDVLLGEDAKLFNQFYGVTEGGNWEHKSILWCEHSYAAFAEMHELKEADLRKQLQRNRERLFSERTKRIYPGLDDKILLDWNALMCSAFAQAAVALNNEEYAKVAERNLEFLLEKFEQADGSFHHTYKAGQTQYSAFLKDYAYLIDALIDMYQITMNTDLLKKKKKITDFVLANFLDETQTMFYFTAADSELIVRKKEVYDSAVPSGNSTMVRNLQRLSVIFDEVDYRALAQKMLLAMSETVTRYPSSFGRWAMGILNEIYPIKEIAIIGTEAKEKAKAIQQQFLPNKVIMISADGDDNFPLLAGKTATDKTLIYVCENYACQRPVEEYENVG